VIVDFGLALGDDEFTYRSTTVCGTYQYMSPQQVLGKADRVDGRSDIYSLGVVLYQLVAGRSPYRSRDVKSLKHEIVTDHPAPLRQYSPEVPVELEQICQRAMAKEPADRYSTAADFAAALRAVIKPIPAKAVSPLAAPARRAPWGPIALSVLGMAILALAALALLPEREAPSPVIPQAAAATPNLQIHFQKHDNESTYSKALADADLPLQVGDKLQFHVAELSKPMYAYIYWINADGDPQRVWPDTSEPLAKQTPVATLSSPPGANDAVNPEWWAVHNVGGPMLFFVGLSEKPLEAEQLEAFEGESSLMRESLLSTMRRSGRPVAEFEHPAQAKTYELRNNELYRTRGGDLHLVISPKVYATDHSQLQKWFSAYHGWIVSAKE
jgi:serine/threonine protein kinase